MNNCQIERHNLTNYIRLAINGQIYRNDRNFQKATSIDFKNSINEIAAIGQNFQFNDDEKVIMDNENIIPLRQLLTKLIDDFCPGSIKNIDKQFIIEINKLTHKTRSYEAIRYTLYNYLKQANPPNEQNIKNIIRENPNIITEIAKFIKNTNSTIYIYISKYVTLFDKDHYLNILTLMGFNTPHDFLKVKQKKYFFVVMTYILSLSNNDANVNLSNLVNNNDSIINFAEMNEVFNNPNRITLDPRQYLTVNRFTKFRNVEDKACFLFHGVGTGKTTTALSIAVSHLTENNLSTAENPIKLKILIIAPSGLFRASFIDDANKLGIYTNNIIIEEIGNGEDKGIIESCDAFIKNDDNSQYLLELTGYDYDSFYKNNGITFINPSDYDVLICDEAHRLITNKLLPEADYEEYKYLVNTTSQNGVNKYIKELTKVKPTGDYHRITITDSRFIHFVNGFKQSIFLTGTPLQLYPHDVATITWFLNIINKSNDQNMLTDFVNNGEVDFLRPIKNYKMDRVKFKTWKDNAAYNIYNIFTYLSGDSNITGGGNMNETEIITIIQSQNILTKFPQFSDCVTNVNGVINIDFYSVMSIVLEDDFSNTLVTSHSKEEIEMIQQSLLSSSFTILLTEMMEKEYRSEYDVEELKEGGAPDSMKEISWVQILYSLTIATKDRLNSFVKYIFTENKDIVIQCLNFLKEFAIETGKLLYKLMQSLYKVTKLSVTILYKIRLLLSSACSSCLLVVRDILYSNSIIDIEMIKKHSSPYISVYNYDYNAYAIDKTVFFENIKQNQNIERINNTGNKYSFPRKFIENIMTPYSKDVLLKAENEPISTNIDNYYNITCGIFENNGETHQEFISMYDEMYSRLNEKEQIYIEQKIFKSNAQYSEENKQININNVNNVIPYILRDNNRFRINISDNFSVNIDEKKTYAPETGGINPLINKIKNNIPSNNQILKSIQISKTSRFDYTLILLKIIRSGFIYHNNNFCLHPHYVKSEDNNYEYFLPVIYPSTTEIMYEFCNYLNYRNHKYIWMNNEFDKVKLDKNYKYGSIMTFPITIEDNSNPICVIISPNHTEGFSFTFNPAIIVPALCKTAGDAEQVYGRVLRKYNQGAIEGQYDKKIYQYFGATENEIANMFFYAEKYGTNQFNSFRGMLSNETIYKKGSLITPTFINKQILDPKHNIARQIQQLPSVSEIGKNIAIGTKKLISSTAALIKNAIDLQKWRNTINYSIYIYLYKTEEEARNKILEILVPNIGMTTEYISEIDELTQRRRNEFFTANFASRVTDNISAFEEPNTNINNKIITEEFQLRLIDSVIKASATYFFSVLKDENNSGTDKGFIPMDLAFIKQYNKDYKISLQNEINCIIYLLKDNAIILPQINEVETTLPIPPTPPTPPTPPSTIERAVPTAETEQQFHENLKEKINNYSSSQDDNIKMQLKTEINEKFNDSKMNIFVKVVLAIDMKNKNINISEIIEPELLTNLENDWINKIIEIEYGINQLSPAGIFRKKKNENEIYGILKKEHKSIFITKDIIKQNPFSQEDDLEIKKQQKLQEISKENERYLQSVNSWFGGKTKRKQTKRKIYKTQHNKKTKNNKTKNNKTKKYNKTKNNKSKNK